MKRAYLIAMLVTINIRWRLEHFRVAKIFMDQHELYVWGPQLVATTPFLFGRQYGMWECGQIEQIDLPDLEQLKAEVKGRPDLKEQLREIREISADGVRKVAETLQYAVGYAHATAVLSQWEGFGRFCRNSLGLEPMAGDDGLQDMAGRPGSGGAGELPRRQGRRGDGGAVGGELGAGVGAAVPRPGVNNSCRMEKVTC